MAKAAGAFPDASRLSAGGATSAMYAGPAELRNSNLPKPRKSPQLLSTRRKEPDISGRIGIYQDGCRRAEHGQKRFRRGRSLLKANNGHDQTCFARSVRPNPTSAVNAASRSVRLQRQNRRGIHFSARQSLAQRPCLIARHFSSFLNFHSSKQVKSKWLGFTHH